MLLKFCQLESRMAIKVTMKLFQPLCREVRLVFFIFTNDQSSS